MNVLLDNIIFSLQRYGGISVYWSEILSRAAAIGLSWIDPYSPPGNDSRIELKSVAYRPPEFFLPPFIERYRNVDSKNSALHSSYYRIPSDSRAPLVTTVHDFTYERFRRGPALWAHHAQKMRALQKSSRILCVSESTARDVVKYGGKHLTPRITVTYEAAAPSFRPVDNPMLTLACKYPWLQSISQNKKILLFVGTRTGYKRFDLAVKATIDYPDSHLVVIGGGTATKQEQLLAQHLLTANRISFLPAIPSQELSAWYSCAYALLYLSEYEGFGLPILEAAQCECPVVAQHNSSLPEVHGLPEFLIKNVSQLVERLTDLENESVRAQVVSKCRSHAQSFSWDRCWEQTLQVYKLF